MMRRVLCVWFPNWPIQRLVAVRPELHERPLVLFAEAARGLSVIACSEQAAEWGIHPGMPLAEARGLKPSYGPHVELSQSVPQPDLAALHKLRTDHKLLIECADPREDRATLQVLAWQCQTYSPLVGLEELETPSSLFLDITGCEGHFGGEEALACQLQIELLRRGYDTRIAIADTIGAAWAMSHYGVSSHAPVAVITPGQHQAVLRSLPIAGLRLAGRIIEPLLKLDVKTIGQVEKLPRTTLPSRFGKELQQRLDQAWGTAHELIIPERLQEPLTSVWNFEEGLSSRQTLEIVVRELLERVLAQLNPRRAGIKELQCHLRGRADCLTLTLRLLQPTLEARHLWGLLQLEWDRQEAAFHKSDKGAPRCLTDGVTSVCVEVAETAPLKVRQQTLFDSEPGQKESLAFRHFVERLSSRLGEKSVLKSEPAPDYQPEYACDYKAWKTDPSGINKVEKERVEKSSWQTSVARTRPLTLLTTPLPIEALSRPSGPPSRIWWGTHKQEVTKHWGPERIATGWWRERDMQRDYYRIETDKGQHLWVFYCRNDAKWFIHGLFE